MIELRCASKLHGILVAPGVLEIKCSSRFCGARPGVVRLHRFDTETGQLKDTREYKNVEPNRRRLP